MLRKLIPLLGALLCVIKAIAVKTRYCAAIYDPVFCRKPRKTLPQCINGTFTGEWLTLSQGSVRDFATNPMYQHFNLHMLHLTQEQITALAPSHVFGASHLPIRSCALVSSSASLVGKKFGASIDRHALVMRMNDAFSSGHEEDVGTFTTLRYTDPSTEGFRQKPREAVISSWCTSPEGPPCTVEALERLSRKKTHPINPLFTQSYIRSAYFSGDIPSAGFMSMLFLMHVCKRVHIYGFNIDRTDPPGQSKYYGRTSARTRGRTSTWTRPSWNYAQARQELHPMPAHQHAASESTNRRHLASVGSEATSRRHVASVGVDHSTNQTIRVNDSQPSTGMDPIRVVAESTEEFQGSSTEDHINDGVASTGARHHQAATQQLQARLHRRLLATLPDEHLKEKRCMYELAEAGIIKADHHYLTASSVAQLLVAAQLDPHKASLAAPPGAEEEEEEEEILREQVELKSLLEGGRVGVPPAVSLYSGNAFDMSGQLYPEELKPASRREQLINQTRIDGLAFPPSCHQPGKCGVMAGWRGSCVATRGRYMWRVM